MRAAALLLVLACACTTKKEPAAVDAGDTASATDGGAAARRAILELPSQLDSCVLGHEGILLDLGAPAARPLYGIGDGGLETTEHDGATWDRISARTFVMHFAGPSDLDHAEAWVDLRVRGLTAKRVTVALNGKLVGTAPLAKNEIAIRSLHATAAQLTGGTNELVLRFGGGGKAPDALAEIDWIRVGTRAAPEYAAPTYDASRTTETLAGVPRRALSLRAPSFARCTTAVPKGATFDAQIGLLGKGSGDFELRVLRDRAAPLSIAKVHVDDASGWKPLSIALPEGAQGVVALELRVDSAAPGARVLVADASLRAPEETPAPRTKTARGVVLVVLGETPTSAATLPTLAGLASRSHVFESHSATSTWAAASVASMLTGVLPIENGADGDGSRLANGLVTIGEAAREASISTAMFTANPTTSAAFGFSRGFQTFQSFLPGSGGSATRALEEAATWIGAHESERFLVVVHARGGHPPWDVPADQLKTLAPDDYSGPIEPGPHAAEILAHARHVPPQVRFNDADRKRAWALHDWAVAAQDASLGRLLAAIDEAGHKDDTAIIVTSDTGLATGAHVPFGDDEPLDESALESVLVFHATGETTGAHTRVPTSSIDVATTVLGELGLAAPQSFEGEDLAFAESDDGARPIFASRGGRQLVSWMGLVAKTGEGPTELCVPALDAACASDASPLAPLASEAVRKLLADASKKKRAAHTPPTLDGPTAAALTAWGR
ncbi:MAG TPA: sulfatase-like hydrolase/transferase [Polyangiaceae bacterium]|jgi:hypothetical protein